MLSLNTPQMSNTVNKPYVNYSAQPDFTVTGNSLGSNVKQSIVYTSSSPFKVTSEINDDYPSNNMMNEPKKSNKYNSGSSGINIRYTEKHMYKEGSSGRSTPLLQDNIEIVAPSVLPSTMQSFDTEIVKRILQVVSKISYDVESLGQKL
ncbi:uncharacterized protein LOC112681908 isoform X1 [Sipha flava]|uniref:Uncharacterized protein LOC112681908 isoform X1 n=1 Tax=Sipha flava TaxID=143950 RepID=A0A8B8FB60_9HEMI|nr:uncharacterized protein LOC112681908 isoform X1 [Sipha flava]XP_025408048.1 uncharacterized protein LOC112681908 isoform X1 [Sipha flava]